MKLRQLFYGIATMLPGMKDFRVKGTGGTVSARYCYSVWLRHIVMSEKNGLNPYPKIVAELGPGDSLGIGLAALISGCEKYYALDVVSHASSERNLQIFDELVSLFRGRTDIPFREFPRVKPSLDSYDFPKHIYTDQRLEKALEPARLERIRRALSGQLQGRDIIEYKVPWFGDDVIEKDSVDMIYSQAVLEHVDDLQSTYRAMDLWLKPSGFMSHQIDFKSHGLADQWNGHWTYSDLTWKLMRGKRSFLINRFPHSVHLSHMEDLGFSIVCDQCVKTESVYERKHFTPRFRNMIEEDLCTSGAFIQSVK